MTDPLQPRPVSRLRLALRALFGTLPPQLAADSRPEPSEPQSTDPHAVSSILAQLDKAFRIERDRLSRLEDYEDMDLGDVAAQLDALIDACLVSDDGQQQSFAVQVRKESSTGASTGTKYQNIVDQMLTDTQLPTNVRQYMRNTGKRGDTFLEVIFDEQDNVRRLKSVPPKWMRVEVDRHGDLKQGEEEVVSGLFEPVQVPLPYRQVNQQENVIAGWYPWEMLHLKWWNDDELIYSRGSFLEGIRRDWRRIRAIEDSMAVARIDRAYMRRIFYVDTHQKTQSEADETIADFKKEMTEWNTSDKRRTEWSSGVSRDLFIGRKHRIRGDRLYDDRTSVDIVDPRNTGLENIADVNYFRSKLFTRVPAEVVGAGVVTGNDLTQQDVAASRMHQYFQWIISQQLIIPLCLLAVKLKGYAPQPENFEVRWPSVVVRGSWRFADARFRESMAHLGYAEWGVRSRERIAQDVYGVDSEEWEAEKERIDREQGDLPTPGSSDSRPNQTRQGNQSASRNNGHKVVAS